MKENSHPSLPMAYRQGCAMREISIEMLGGTCLSLISTEFRVQLADHLFKVVHYAS